MSVSATPADKSINENDKADGDEDAAGAEAKAKAKLRQSTEKPEEPKTSTASDLKSTGTEMKSAVEFHSIEPSVELPQSQSELELKIVDVDDQIL